MEFQILLSTKLGQNPLKDVDSRVFTRMLRKDGRTDGSVTISLCNFVGEGIISFLTNSFENCLMLSGICNILVCI
jgi:hypothetical protein